MGLAPKQRGRPSLAKTPHTLLWCLSHLRDGPRRLVMVREERAGTATSALLRFSVKQHRASSLTSLAYSDWVDYQGVTRQNNATART